MRGLCGQVSAAAAGVAGRFAAILALVLLMLFTPNAAVPAEPVEPPQPKYGWREVWAGTDAMRDVWLLYSGVTLAPWSDHIYDPGVRLRMQAGYGRYDYTLYEDGAYHHYLGEVTTTDALIGYHWRFGELTAKVFGGVAMIDRQGKSSTEHAHIFGLEYGPKGVLELWLNVSEQSWTSLNLSYTTAHETASGRWRFGYKIFDDISIGPELRFDTSDFRPAGRDGFFDQYLGRAGLFLTYKMPGLEFAFAGGVATRFRGIDPEQGADGLSHYGTVNVLFQY